MFGWLFKMDECNFIKDDREALAYDLKVVGEDMKNAIKKLDVSVKKEDILK